MCRCTTNNLHVLVQLHEDVFVSTARQFRCCRSPHAPSARRLLSSGYKVVPCRSSIFLPVRKRYIQQLTCGNYNSTLTVCRCYHTVRLSARPFAKNAVPGSRVERLDKDGTFLLWGALEARRYVGAADA